MKTWHHCRLKGSISWSDFQSNSVFLNSVTELITYQSFHWFSWMFLKYWRPLRLHDKPIQSHFQSKIAYFTLVKVFLVSFKLNFYHFYLYQSQRKLSIFSPIYYLSNDW